MNNVRVIITNIEIPDLVQEREREVSGQLLNEKEKERWRNVTGKIMEATRRETGGGDGMGV